MDARPLQHSCASFRWGSGDLAESATPRLQEALEDGEIPRSGSKPFSVSIQPNIADKQSRTAGGGVSCTARCPLPCRPQPDWPTPVSSLTSADRVTLSLNPCMLPPCASSPPQP